LEARFPTLDAIRKPVSKSNGQRSGLEAGGGIPCQPNLAATLLVIIIIVVIAIIIIIIINYKRKNTQKKRTKPQPVINKNLAIANRSRVSCAQNSSRASP